MNDMIVPTCKIQVIRLMQVPASHPDILLLSVDIGLQNAVDPVGVRPVFLQSFLAPSALPSILKQKRKVLVPRYAIVEIGGHEYVLMMTDWRFHASKPVVRHRSRTNSFSELTKRLST